MTAENPISSENLLPSVKIASPFSAPDMGWGMVQRVRQEGEAQKTDQTQFSVEHRTDVTSEQGVVARIRGRLSR
jgi:hypothetical protein